jgi:glycosyltransferase involved in cell wall biosynthesis
MVAVNIEIYKPKISVLMSVYNGERFVRESIESVLSQTMTDFEFIIVNDASTDATMLIIKEYEQKDNRIRLFNNQENIGLTLSLNKGLKQCCGTYIARQDADDVSLCHRFEKQVDVLNSNTDVALVSSFLEYIDDQGRIINEVKMRTQDWRISWQLFFHNAICGHSQVMMRNSVVRSLGGYAGWCKYAQDYELWSRMTVKYKVEVIPEVLVQYRRHPNTISKDKQIEQEQFASTIRRKALLELLDIDMKNEQLLCLKQFCLGEPIARVDYKWLHKTLNQMMAKFIYRYNEHKGAVPSLRKKLKNVIGSRYLTLVHSLCGWAKIQPLVYFFLWDIKGAVLLCVRKILTLNEGE